MDLNLSGVIVVNVNGGFAKFLRAFCLKCHSSNVNVHYGIKFVFHKCRELGHETVKEYKFIRLSIQKYVEG
jgi:hypothetical protein